MVKNIFNFSQKVAISENLKVNELLLLDYIYGLFNLEEKFDDLLEKYYCRLSYKKILEDLPILQIQERQLRNLIIGLEKKGFLERYSEFRNQLYVFVNFKELLKVF